MDDMNQNKPIRFKADTQRCHAAEKGKTMRVLMSLLMVLGTSNAFAQDSAFDLKFKSLGGNEKSLGDFKGKVLMVVNTASHCGYTKQYTGLQKVYESYKDKGLVVVGFPSTSFNQEFKDEGEVAKFCKVNFGVTFPMAGIIEVKGKNQSPIFGYLTQKGPKETQGDVEWNFEKFLVNREGKVVARFRSGIDPMGKEVKDVLEKLL
jgi:glutathione peroxidase